MGLVSSSCGLGVGLVRLVVGVAGFVCVNVIFISRRSFILVSSLLGVIFITVTFLASVPFITSYHYSV